MGFRQASGTKPSDLATPVPGDMEANLQTALSKIKPAIQETPAPMAGSPDALAPTPIPSQAGFVDDIDAPVTDLGNEAIASPEVEKKEPIDHYAELQGKDVEGSLLGFHVKVNKDGTVTTSLPGQSKYTPPNEAQASAARAMFYTLRDAGSTGGMVLGDAAGAAAGILTGGVASLPLASAGGAAGGAIGSKANQYILDHLKSNPSGAKFLYLLQKMGGISDEDANNPSSAGASALIGGLSPIASALLGGITSKVGGLIDQSTSSAAGKAVVDSTAPALADITEAANATGVALSPADAMAKLPGGSSAVEANENAASGLFGADVQKNYQVAAQKKQDQLKNFLTGLVQKAAPGVDFSKPSTLGIAQSTKSGFKNQNLIDKFIDNFGKVLGDYTQDANQKAGGKQFDIEPLYQNALKIIRSTGADDLADALESGNIDLSNRILKDGYSVNENMQGLVNEFHKIENVYNRNSAFAKQEGTSVLPVESTSNSALGQAGASKTPTIPSSAENMSPNTSGKATAGATYDWINRYVNSVQEISSQKQNPLVQQLAGAARAHEGDVLSKIYENNPSMVREIQGANQMYSNSIGGLRDLSKAITSGSANIGGAVLNFDAPTIRMLKSVMSEEELSTFRGASLNAGLKDELIKDPINGVNPSKIYKTFFSGSREEAMTELLGDKTMDLLKKSILVAKHLDAPNISQQASEAGAKEVAKYLPGMSKALGGWNAVKTTMGRLFDGNKDALDLINSSINDYAKYLPATSVSSNRQAIGGALKNASPYIKEGTKRALQGSQLSYDLYQGDNK